MAHRKLTAVVIDALEDIKARDIKLINVSRLTSVFDYIAVASAESTRQTRALAKHVIDKVKEYGGWIYGTEGEQSGEWVLVDCGDVVVHIMQPAVREHYKLEELWGDGKLEFPKPAVRKRKPATPVAPAKTRARAKITVKKPATAKPKATKPTTTKTKATKPTTAKARSSGATAKAGKETVATSGLVTKKVAAKAGTAVRKKTAATTVKKTVAKKPVARKPVARRRKAVE